MQKPTVYDEAKAGFEAVNLGGHYAVIKQVSEKNSSTGKPMIVVLFDFDQNDPQKGYFTDMFNSFDKEPKKWPFAGSKYIMVQDYQDPSKTSRNFKSFVTTVEKSNNVKVAWGGANWGKQFIGKKIGVVYGEEEQEYNGETSMRRVPKWFCLYEKAKDASIPAPKLLPAKAPAASSTDSEIDGFLSLPENTEEEIPF